MNTLIRRMTRSGRDCHDESGSLEQTIRFSVTSSSRGLVLVASTDRGLCAVLVGDTPAGLIADLEKRFPDAQIVEHDGPWVANVLDCLNYATNASYNLVARRRRVRYLREAVR
jgi:hypothetical protein